MPPNPDFTQKPTDGIIYPQFLFTQAAFIVNILRDHLATLSIVLKHLATKIPNGYETTVATRLDNHVKELNKSITRPEWYHDKPVTPFELVDAVQKLAAECAMCVISAESAADRNPELANCTKALIHMKTEPSIKTYAKWHKYYRKAKKIASQVVQWIDTVTVTKTTLREIHGTMNLLVENITEKELYDTALIPCELIKPSDGSAAT